METKKLTKQEIAQAAAAIQAGELVAFQQKLFMA